MLRYLARFAVSEEKAGVKSFFKFFLWIKCYLHKERLLSFTRSLFILIRISYIDISNKQKKIYVWMKSRQNMKTNRLKCKKLLKVLEKRRTTWIKIIKKKGKKSYKTNIKINNLTYYKRRKIKEATKRRDCWPGSVQRKTRQNNDKTGFSFQFILTNIKKLWRIHFFFYINNSIKSHETLFPSNSFNF